VNAVIATLGTMAAFRGLGLILTDGRSVSVFNEGFRDLARPLLFLPVPIWMMLAVLAVFFVFLRYTIPGRNIYAIGGNPVVARLAGIDLMRYRLGIYALSGLAAGLSGVILVARTGSGHPVSGSEGLELEAITAAILGGAALTGGKGTIVGALLGVLILGTLTNGMILTGVPSFYQMVAKGALLIIAVIIQEYQLRRTGEAS
jgi:ribose transport system permease protein/L-arabinose transport system permease protein